MNPRRHRRYLIPTLIVLAVIVVIALVVIVAANRPDRAAQCRTNGGVVQTDTETKRKKVNGKWKTTTVTEYECIKNGQEIDEWK